MTAIASLKSLARDMCGQGLSLARVTAPGVRLRGRLSIITFHRVLTAAQRQSYPLPGLAVTPDELDSHLQFATRHFRCMSLAAAMNLWARDDHRGPPLLAITFDDGQLDNYQNALPVLERNGVTASFYIPSQILEDPSPLWHDALAMSIALLNAGALSSTGRSTLAAEGEHAALITELHAERGAGPSPSHTAVEAALEATKSWTAGQRKDWIRRAQAILPAPPREPWDGFMDVAQMKDLIARGHEIGSHSHSHPLLPHCTAEELVTEIAGSRQRLESALGAPVTTFCYPNGSTSPLAVEQVRKAGYSAAVTTRWGSNPRGHDPFLLQRFDMNATHAQDRHGRFSPARLAWRISGLHPGLTGTSEVDAYSGAAA